MAETNMINQPVVIFIIFLSIEPTGQQSRMPNDTAQPSTINVAGAVLKLPLSIAIISDIFCRVNVTGPTCPFGYTSYTGAGALEIAVMPLAFNHINNDTELWPFHNMKVSVLNTQLFKNMGVRFLREIARNNETLAVFGLIGTCEQEARLAQEANKLVLSHFCTPLRRYSTFVQLHFGVQSMAKAATNIMRAHGWDRTVILYFLDSRLKDLIAIYDYLNENLLPNGIRTVHSYIVPIYQTVNSKVIYNRYTPQSEASMIVAKVLKETYLLTKVYTVLSATSNGVDAYYLLEAMGRMGLLQTGEYAVLIIYSKQQIAYSFDGTSKTSQFLLTNIFPSGVLYKPIPEQMYQNYRSALLFTEAKLQNPVKWERFLSAMVDISAQQPPCPPLCNMTYQKFPSISAANQFLPVTAAKLYEAIVHYARLTTQLIKENKTNITDGFAMRQHFYRVNQTDTWSGVPIQLDSYGMPFETVAVSTATYDPDGRPSVRAIGMYQSSMDGISKMKFRLNPGDTFRWINGDPPPAGPKCGFTGELCPSTVDNRIWISAIFAVVVAVFLATSIFYFWMRVSSQKKLEHSLWKVLLKDVVFRDVSRMESISNIWAEDSSVFSSAASLRLHASQRLLKEHMETGITDLEEKPVKSPGQPKKQPVQSSDLRWDKLRFASAMYREKLVAVKKLKKRQEKPSLKLQEEIKMMTSISHDNLNPFVGIIYQSSAVALVSEYCHKGSLKDILDNDAIKLDHIFRAAIISDIINGMEYLQSLPLRCHGRLKSTNVLIDARWLVKLSDFGLFSLRLDEESWVSVEEGYAKLFWTAPELLRSNNYKRYGTSAGDAYSFGVILFELFGRQSPYAETFLENKDILEKIKSPRLNEPPFRPDIRVITDAPDCVHSTIRGCWAEEPSERPSFSELKSALEPLKKGLSENLLDNMLMMIQKYSNNLEELVTERTQQLEVERQKSDALLASMLPKKVADTLKCGDIVEPEYFDSVTVYFSDIVDFAHIMSSYSPYQVVKFLHEMYATFDTMIGKFDVYKVETIGDSYIVVSGLPNRNGERHAGEIAMMALAFRKSALDQKIRHPSGDIVQLRIGIHSGPCVAGVVGLRMPRYCLFGDTVNTTSRIETTGQGLKIHCSRDCKYKLDTLGGFETIDRGFVSMKGKGEQQTYWLLSGPETA